MLPIWGQGYIIKSGLDKTWWLRQSTISIAHYRHQKMRLARGVSASGKFTLHVGKTNNDVGTFLR